LSRNHEIVSPDHTACYRSPREYDDSSHSLDEPEIVLVFLWVVEAHEVMIDHIYQILGLYGNLVTLISCHGETQSVIYDDYRQILAENRGKNILVGGQLLINCLLCT
jgi:hypothetical protein